MERNNRRIQRASEAGNESLRNAAAKFVAARFDARNHALITPEKASQIAGYSTVTVSGASSAGLQRCAYTLGKWQNSAKSAAARKPRKDDINRQFPAIESSIAARHATLPGSRQTAKAASDTRQAEQTTGTYNNTVASFEDYSKPGPGKKVPLDNKPAPQQAQESAGNLADSELVNSFVNNTTDEVGLQSTITGGASVAATTDTRLEHSSYTGEERRIAGDRRDYTIKTLLHCLKNPQRSTDRRKADNLAVRYPLLDVFDGSAMFLAVALTTLSLCDAFFTLNILARGGQEVNPLMNYMLGYGTFAFVASKMFFTAVAVIVMTGASNLLLFRRVRVRSVLATLVGLYCGLIVYELLILAMA